MLSLGWSYHVLCHFCFLCLEQKGSYKNLSRAVHSHRTYSVNLRQIIASVLVETILIILRTPYASLFEPSVYLKGNAKSNEY